MAIGNADRRPMVDQPKTLRRDRPSLMVVAGDIDVRFRYIAHARDAIDRRPWQAPATRSMVEPEVDVVKSAFTIVLRWTVDQAKAHKSRNAKVFCVKVVCKKLIGSESTQELDVMITVHETYQPAAHELNLFCELLDLSAIESIQGISGALVNATSSLDNLSLARA
jgi:hypothetical protein